MERMMNSILSSSSHTSGSQAWLFAWPLDRHSIPREKNGVDDWPTHNNDREEFATSLQMNRLSLRNSRLKVTTAGKSTNHVAGI